MARGRAGKDVDKDLPLREDIRLLGRVLGDTLRDDAGQAMFDLVEQIRRAAVRYRKDHDVATREDPVFGLAVPTAVRNVPAEVLDPRGTWPDAAAYDAQAQKLASMFRANFERDLDIRFKPQD